MSQFGRFEFGKDKASETYEGDFMSLEKGYVKILKGQPGMGPEIETVAAVIHLDKGQSVREV